MIQLVTDAFKVSMICFVFIAMGEPGMIFAWYGKLINNLPDWLNKPLGGCGYCMTGQAALWFFIFTKPFDLFNLLFFISLSIFFISIYEIIWYYERT